MEYENMRVLELKVLTRDRELRNYSLMRKADLVALLQNNPPPLQSGGPRAPAPHTRSPPHLHRGTQRRALVGSHGNGWIVTDERYVVMPWKVVIKHGKNMTLTEAVDSIFSCHESEAKERERQEREKEEIESKRKEYYETHMKKEMERLNNWVGWYERKLKEIDEALVDSRLRMLERLYRVSEKNKNCGVMITSAGVINPVSYPVYPPELKLLEYKSLDCVSQTPVESMRRTPLQGPDAEVISC